MTYVASHRGARISPQKARRLADLVRGKLVDQALDILRYQPHRGARLIESVIKSAAANAVDPDQNKGESNRMEDLFVSSVRIDCGPMFKRIRPRARGMAFQIKKRLAHIHVEVDTL